MLGLRMSTYVDRYCTLQPCDHTFHNSSVVLIKTWPGDDVKPYANTLSMVAL